MATFCFNIFYAFKCWFFEAQFSDVLLRKQLYFQCYFQESFLNLYKANAVALIQITLLSKWVCSGHNNIHIIGSKWMNKPIVALSFKLPLPSSTFLWHSKWNCHFICFWQSLSYEFLCNLLCLFFLLFFFCFISFFFVVVTGIWAFPQEKVTY